MNIGRKIQFLRAKHNYYIYLVAEYLGINDKEYMDIECGKVNPSEEIIRKIASLYGVKEESLTSDDNKIVIISSKKEQNLNNKQVHLRN